MTTIESRSPLSNAQRRIVTEMVAELATITGIDAIVLGGSFATGFATEHSDIDLGLMYRGGAAFPIDALREIAARFDDSDTPLVTEPYGWGPWANGGAWLLVRGQRVDMIYRSLDQIDAVIDAAEAGEFETHYDQMPPFGFFGPTYLGEVRVAIALHDPHGRLAALKARVATYPDALRRAIVDSRLWAVEFGLSAFASKFAARGDVFLTAASLARFSQQLVMVLYALNERYPVNDKVALIEVDRFAIAPVDFRRRVETLLAATGADPDSLCESVGELEALFRDTVALAGDLYRTRALPAQPLSSRD